MRMTAIAAACLVASLALAGCGTTGMIDPSQLVTQPLPVTPNDNVQQRIDDIVAQAKSYARGACGVEPIIANAANLVGGLAGYGSVTTIAKQIADTFCQQVASMAATRRGVRPITVNGVTVGAKVVNRARFNAYRAHRRG